MCRKHFYIVQTMNAVVTILFLLCCIHASFKGFAVQADGGALTVVLQDDDNEAVTVDSDDEDSTQGEATADVFRPTNKWQTVKTGQTIPPGLHVQMNFETGQTEAKLMDGDNGVKYWKAGDRQGMVNMDRRQFTVQELKRALKNFKTTQMEDTDLQREDMVKKKFRSYAELKKDFAELNMGIKTDQEIIKELLDRLKTKGIGRDAQLTILTDLEYYLHQIDNAVLFKDLGGLPHIIQLLNNTEDEELQVEAALVLGSATSGNPKVQIGAVDAGALELLLRLMSTKSSVKLRRKIMFAISTLCRHFPYAQKRFLELGGLSTLAHVFTEQGTDKLQVKSISFLNDLLIEKALTEKHSNLDKTSDAEKLRQYHQVLLLEAILEQGWCERIPMLLELSDHESRESILNAMDTLVDHCKLKFHQSLDNLNKLRSEYLVLSINEQNDDYFTNLLSVIERILRTLTRKDEL